jgi:hypothetical protein
VLEQVVLPPHRDYATAVQTNRAKQTHRRPAWLFQANPAYYDIRGAVDQLSEMNWTVAQSKNEIRAGHPVYLWESGPGDGVLARLRIDDVLSIPISRDVLSVHPSYTN